MREKQEYGKEQSRTPGTGHEIIEMLSEVRARHEVAHKGFTGIVQSPSCHNTVIREYKETGQHTHKTGYHPRFARGQHTIRADHIGVAGTSYDKLGHHNRHGQEEHTHQVYQNKSSPAVAATFCWETPYIAQSHGTAGRGKYGAYLASEISTFHNLNG